MSKEKYIRRPASKFIVEKKKVGRGELVTRYYKARGRGIGEELPELESFD